MNMHKYRIGMPCPKCKIKRLYELTPKGRTTGWQLCRCGWSRAGGNYGKA